MKIPIEVDQQLIAEALALSHFSTENQLREEALREYIQRSQQQKILEL